MFSSNFAARVSSIYRLIVELACLPVADLHFCSQPSPKHIRDIYRYFTKPHPKYKIFGNKAMGAALIELRAYPTGRHFIDSLRIWGRAGAERRRALSRGYRVSLIDRNSFVDAIHQINVSSSVRQGRPMDHAYLEKQLRYLDFPHFRYYGAFDREQRLVAYCNVCILGNFAITDRILGLKMPDGAMYLMLTEITSALIEEQKLEYLMYDTVFGALPGLRDFKRRLGFKPYRARYTIE
jgi:hypothetical protein